jgi:hypothetical protein
MNLLKRLMAPVLGVALIGLPGVQPAHAQLTGGQLGNLCPNKQYVKGQYECVQFSQEFLSNCANAGITAWTLIIYINHTLCPPPLRDHQLDIVQVCDPYSIFPEFCAVEPQNGNQVCWHQVGPPPVVPDFLYDQIAMMGIEDIETCDVICKGLGRPITDCIAYSPPGTVWSGGQYLTPTTAQ